MFGDFEDVEAGKLISGAAGAGDEVAAAAARAIQDAQVNILLVHLLLILVDVCCTTWASEVFLGICCDHRVPSGHVCALAVLHAL